jgi:AhpD family alkylhydroperoxidase
MFVLPFCAFRLASSKPSHGRSVGYLVQSIVANAAPKSPRDAGWIGGLLALTCQYNGPPLAHKPGSKSLSGIVAAVLHACPLIRAAVPPEYVHREARMATVKLWTDAEAEAHPKVRAIFEDIRTTRKSDFVNNFWRGLANQPEVLERTWETLKAVMGAPGPLDPLTRELIYIAVSITNGCSYCIHSHTAAARAKGMTDAQYSDFLAVVAMASQTNALVTGLQLPVDEAFLIEG